MTAVIDVLRRAAVPLVVLALVVGAGIVLFGGGDRKQLTAHFPRTVSVYEGSDVRILGVPVGTVDSVTPSGTDVVVTMSYESDVQVPEDAVAVIIAPSVVGDRYVQLTPAYEGGPVLADGAVLETDRTSIPLELDQIYEGIDELMVALGPNGANKNGALTDLLEVTADNFGGQGQQFHQAIGDFSKLSETLDDNKEELFGSMRELQGFISTLAENDDTVRTFNDSLAGVSSMLEGEREELAAVLVNLSSALGQVSTFVKDNREVLGKNIRGLNRVAKVLAKQRKALDETLTNAPLALNNLYLTYNPQSGTLDTNANLTEVENQIVTDPSTFLCGILLQANQSGELCDVVQGFAQRPGTFGAGPGARPQADLSLGGLVEVSR